MSAGISVRIVQSRRERRQFQTLPWLIYEAGGTRDANWVPPLLAEERELLGWGNHPFYDNAEGASLLAQRGGQTVGRLHVLINHVHNRTHGEHRGFFGFFESMDDDEVANELFRAGEAWLRERDMNAVRGPVNPSLNHTCGLLVDGHSGPPRLMMTYNRPYYERLLESCGLTPSQDLFAYELSTAGMEAASARYRRALDSVAARSDVVIRPFDPKRFTSELRSYLDSYNRGLERTWGFAPLQPREAERIARDLKHVIVPEMALFAEVAGKPAGAVLALPDYNQILRHCNGRLFPFGIVRLLLGRGRIDTARALAITMSPEYRHAGLGVLLMHRLIEPARRRGIQNWEFSWVLESNMASRKPLEKMGAKITRTYRLYDKALG